MPDPSQTAKSVKKYYLLQIREAPTYTLNLNGSGVMRIILTLLGVLLVLSPVALRAQSDKNLVSVPVSVSDREGRYLTGLKKDDFTILEDGKEQKISFFATEDEPVSIALLLDTSESTKAVLDQIREAAKDFIELLNKNDQCLVATFDSEVKVLEPFTSDREALKKSLDKIRTDEREGTVVFSAVDKIAREHFVRAQGRKVIVILSDGKDYGSAVSKNELFAGLEESDVMIYSVFYQTGRVFVDSKGAVKEATPDKKVKEEKPKKKKKGYSIRIALPRDTNTPEEIKLADKVASAEAVNILQEMSDTTAGRFYMSDAPNLSRIFKQIAAELRQQYRLGFNSSSGAKDGDVSSIIVKVKRADAVVRTRGKYRAKKL
jgi:Ca-activated chloride channel homolog